MKTLKQIAGDVLPVDLADTGSLTRAHLPSLIWSLSRIQRWSGALLHDWSVAQHSLLVAALVPDDLKPAALAHDLHEGIAGDMPTPLKTWLAPKADRYENDMQARVFALLGISESPKHPLLAEADRRALALEAYAFSGAYARDQALHAQSCWKALAADPAGITKTERETLIRLQALTPVSCMKALGSGLLGSHKALGDMARQAAQPVFAVIP